MRVLVLADMEGASGIGAECPTPDEIARAMARDVNAAAKGFIAGGATEIEVIDAHASGGNLNAEDLAPGARLLGGSLALAELLYDRRRSSAYDGWALIGLHAMAGTPDAFMAHTNYGQLVKEVRFAGQPVGEIALWTWLAGSLGSPVLAITGDRAACQEAASMIPGVEQAPVKERRAGLDAVLCLPEDAAAALIGAACRRAALRHARTPQPPLLLEGAVRMELTMKSQRVMPVAAILPRSTTRDCTISYEGLDYSDAFYAYLTAIVLAGAAATMPR